MVLKFHDQKSLIRLHFALSNLCKMPFCKVSTEEELIREIGGLNIDKYMDWVGPEYIRKETKGYYFAGFVSCENGKIWVSWGEEDCLVAFFYEEMSFATMTSCRIAEMSIKYDRLETKINWLNSHMFRKTNNQPEASLAKQRVIEFFNILFSLAEKLL